MASEPAAISPQAPTLLFANDDGGPDAFPGNAVSTGALADGVIAGPAAFPALLFPSPSGLPGAISLAQLRLATTPNRNFPLRCLTLDVVRLGRDGLDGQWRRLQWGAAGGRNRD